MFPLIVVPKLTYVLVSTLLLCTRQGICKRTQPEVANGRIIADSLGSAFYQGPVHYPRQSW